MAVVSIHAPAGGATIVQHEASYKNPYGSGLLDEAYWYSKGLAANFEYHLGFLEDDGRDPWMGFVPPGSSNDYKDKVEAALRPAPQRRRCRHRRRHPR
ncbi:MAG: hypothetical protein FDX02_08470 [Chlorobium sp.]|nr:MAG: hypothetical protein FDX02_08470 [Chlorobium sp.]